MSLGVYDKNLMEFAYFLTRNQKYSDSIDIAEKLKVSGQKISDRTIRRWFDKLEKGCFDYYPNIKVESLGLAPLYIVIEAPVEEDVFQIIPHRDYVTLGYTTTGFHKSVCLKYLIPPDSMKQFEEFWKRAKKGGVIRDYKIYPFYSSTDFYSPLHKVVQKNGELNFSKIGEFDNSHYTELFEKSLKNPLRPALSTHVLKNPLLVPVLLEYYREHWTRQKVWKSIRKKLGENVWNYLRKARKQSDGVGLFMVQKTLRNLDNEYYEDFFQQIRVFYEPWLKKGVSYYGIFETQKKEGVAKLFEEVSKHCLMQTVYPIVGGGFMFYQLTNGTEIADIIAEFRKFDPDARFEMFWRDLKASSKYWDRNFLKMDYTLFDPETMTWKYEHEKYMKTLDSLIKSKDVIRAKTRA